VGNEAAGEFGDVAGNVDHRAIGEPRADDLQPDGPDSDAQAM
jgi:hypothetical protein